jgi:EAL domain-containing protein (putative c-di-GMP-specific phosphodiesterase class I)/ActR/RegA family two-component response regulator
MISENTLVLIFVCIRPGFGYTMPLAPVTLKRDEANSPVAYVLDDDRKVSVLISRMLRVAGFVAIPFTEPSECLKQLRAADAYTVPTVFVLDLSLGKCDGIEVLDCLKALKYKGRVLLISGKDASALLEIERMGASRGLEMLPSLQKPFEVDDLIARLKIECEPAKPPSRVPVATPWADALKRAVSSGSVVLRYQARIDFKSQLICGAEVLMYEQHSSGNLLPLPTSFDPSNASIYHPLSRSVIRTLKEECIQHLSALERPFRLFVTLPLSVAATPGFISLVREHLSQHPQFLSVVLQVNDWSHFNNAKIVRELSARLKLYGIGLSVDDIGALYSSVTKSQAFPFDEFKLTADYVSNCALNESKKQVCADVINLAHSVGAKVCAQGVMNRDELTTLIGIHCDTGQGYLFGEPLRLEVFKTKYLGSPASQQVNATSDADDDMESLVWPGAGS